MQCKSSASSQQVLLSIPNNLFLPVSNPEMWGWLFEGDGEGKGENGFDGDGGGGEGDLVGTHGGVGAAGGGHVPPADQGQVGGGGAGLPLRKGNHWWFLVVLRPKSSQMMQRGSPRGGLWYGGCMPWQVPVCATDRPHNLPHYNLTGLIYFAWLLRAQKIAD